MKDNPQAALAAITTPGELTLGKMALLVRLDSPVLAGDISDICDTLTAIYVLEQPLQVSAANFATIREKAVVEYDGLSAQDYQAKVGTVLDAVSAFLEMLPRPSPDAKKNSATDGAQSSPNGCAGLTPTASTTSSKSCRRSRPRCSGDAGRRGPEAARPARC